MIPFDRCGKVQQIAMVPFESAEVCFDGNRNLTRIFNCKKVSDNLRVVLGLTGKAQCGISLFCNLCIGHNLYDL